VGKSDKRRIVEREIALPSKPEGFFGEREVNGMCLKTKCKGFLKIVNASLEARVSFNRRMLPNS